MQPLGAPPLPERKRPKIAPLKEAVKEEPTGIDLRQEITKSNSFNSFASRVLSQDLSDENVEIIRVLGKGTQATVYLADYKPNKIPIALKKVVVRDKLELLCLQRELLSLGNCIHPNILRCFGVRVASEQVILSLEYMDWGTLKSFIENEGPIPEVIISLIMLQVLKGMAYLHKERKIIHRDIKPSNLLINSKGEVKIADFGIARQVGGTEGQANTFLGTLLYMSPERINGKDYQMNCDIWALGLVAYECALGRFPGLDDPKKATLLDLRKLLTENKLLQFPPQFSEKLISFLTCCLQIESEKRARAADLLDHPFVKQALKVKPELFKEWLKTVVMKAIHKNKKSKA